MIFFTSITILETFTMNALNDSSIHNMTLSQASQIQLNKVETSLNVFQALQKEQAVLTKQLNDEMREYNKILANNSNEDIEENAKLNFFAKRRRELSTLSSFILQQLVSELNDYFMMNAAG